ncbi:hypothetical protein NQZ68_032814 [Dissostichus eleginoides]|nr:hypothetical protein NQZ68_032814 [Dissostichus eleginoides]
MSCWVFSPPAPGGGVELSETSIKPQKKKQSALLSVVVLSWTFVIYASRVAADWLLEERTALLQQQ